MGAISRHIGQSQGTVTVLHQGEGDLTPLGNIQLVGGGAKLFRIEQSNRVDALALIAVGHIPCTVVACLDTDIAVGIKGSNQFAIHKQVLAHVGIILLAGIVAAVDVSEEVEVLGLFLQAAAAADSVDVLVVTSISADHTDAITIDMAANQTTTGTNAVVVLMGTGPSAQGANAVVILMVTGTATNRTGTATPNVVTVGSIFQLIHRSGFHLTGAAGTHDRICPVGEIRPTLISVLLVVVGVALSVNLRHEEPIRVRTGRMGGLVAHITGIASVAIGIGGAVVSVESGIVARLAGRGIYGTGVAPVVVQVAHYLIRIDRGSGGFGFCCRDLLALVVVLAVKAVAGIEAGGPAVDIVDRTGTGLDPLAALEGIAVHSACRGGLGLVVRIAVLGLGSEQAAVHACRNVIQPAGCQLISRQRIVVAAVGAGKFVQCVLLTGCGLISHGVAVTAGGDHLLIHIATNGTSAGLGTIGSTGGIVHHPRTIGVPLGSIGVLGNLAALGTRGDGGTDGRTGSRLNGCGGIGVGTGGLAGAGGNHHEVFRQQIHRAGIGAQTLGRLGIVVGIGSRNGIGILTLGQVTERGSVVDAAAFQAVGITADRITAAGNLGTGGSEIRVDVHRSGVDTVTRGFDVTTDGEGLACHMAVGDVVIGNLNIRGDLLDICSVTCVNIARFSAGGLHLIPVVTAGVLVHAHRGHGSTGGQGLHGFTVVGTGSTGFGVDGGAGSSLKLTAGGVESTLGGVTEAGIGTGSGRELGNALQVVLGVQCGQRATAVLGTAGVSQTKLTVQNIVTGVAAGGGEATLGAVIGIESTAGDHLHELIVVVGTAGTVADQLATHTVTTAGLAVVDATSVDVDTDTGCTVTGAACVRVVPTGVAVGGMGRIVTIVVDGGHLVNTVQNGGRATSLVTRGNIVGIIGDGGTLFAVEGNRRLATGHLHHDTHSLQTNLSTAVDILVGVVVVRAALKHKNNGLTGGQSTGQGTVVVDVVFHHGVDVISTGSIRNKSRTGQSVQTTDGCLCLDLDLRYESRKQADHQANDQDH